MGIVFTIIKAALFIASNIGVWELLRRRTGIDDSFIPGLTVALQTTALFAAGILNLLPAAVWLMYAFGLFCLFYFIRGDKSAQALKRYTGAGYIYLAAVTAAAAILLKGAVFTDFDDFTHWAVAVKQLLAENRFPNFSDSVITFREYPMGSTVYIYYASTLVSRAESFQMLAQVYMIAAALTPLLFFCKKERLPALLCLLGFSYFVLGYNIPVTSLMVDTLLPVVSMSMLAYIYIYCRTAEHPVRFYLAGAYMVQTVQIKNSGVFFVMIAAVWMISLAVRERRFKSRAALLSVPLVSFILWQAHCGLVYEDSKKSTHALSLSAYCGNMASKPAGIRKDILLALLQFIVGFRDVWIVLCVFAAVGALVYMLRAQDRRLLAKAGILCAAMFAAYTVGLAMVYIFSMSSNEALRLTSCSRYCRTVLLAVMYVIMIFCMRLLSSAGKKRPLVWVLAAAFALTPLLCLQLSAGSVALAGGRSGNDPRREWLENALEKHPVTADSTCCILTDDPQFSYIQYAAQYLTMSGDIPVRVIYTDEDMTAAAHDVETRMPEHIIVYEQRGGIIRDWVEANYPEQAGNDIISAYR